MDKKKFVASALDEQTHAALMRMATSLGMHPSDLIEQYIQRGIQEDLEGSIFKEDTTLPLQIHRMWMRVREAQNLRFQLRGIARALVASTDDLLLDQFVALCSAAGCTPTEIMEEAQNDASLVGSNIELDPTPVQEACDFLREVLANGVEMPSTELSRLAAQRGISESALKAARSKLQVVASNCGRQWKVRLPIAFSSSVKIER